MSKDGWNFDLNDGEVKKAEFAKFPVGITRIRILDEAPVVRWTHFLNQFKRSINCPGRGCPICEIRKQQKANKETQTYAMGRRLAINIFNLETGKVEICEQGVTFFEELKDVVFDAGNDVANLSDIIIKVRRKGTGKSDTSYRLDVDSIQPMSEEDLNKCNEDKTDFEEYFKPHTNEQILRIVKGESWDDVMMPKDNDEDTPNTDTEDEEEEYEVR